MQKFVIAIVVSSVILFLWSGATQMLPWGVPTTQNVNVQTDDTVVNSQVPNFVRLPDGSLTTEAFGDQFINQISTYTTDDTFSWIVTRPLNTNYTRYFVGEAITSLIVSIFLMTLLHLTVQLDLRTRLMLVAVAGLAAVSATYGQLMNWWGIPATYGLGVSANLLIGWLIASFVSARFIIKSETHR